MRTTARQWSVALGVAAALHLAVALVPGWKQPPAGTDAPGSIGLGVSLGLAAGVPSMPAADNGSAVNAQSTPATELAVKDVPLPQMSESQPVDAKAAEAESVKPAEVATVESLQTSMAPDAPRPREIESIDAAEAPVEPSPAEVSVADAVPQAAEESTELRDRDTAVPEEIAARSSPAAAPEPPEVEPREAEPPRPAETEVIRAEVAEAVETHEAAVAPAAPLETVDTGAVESEAGREAADAREHSSAGGEVGLAGESRTGESAAGQSGAHEDYLLVLRSWLERHKRYPTRARRFGQEGTAFLYFVMNRAGDVIDYEIRRSSGHRLLDDEAERMILRAQPLPKIPESMNEAQLALVIPIEFSLR